MAEATKITIPLLNPNEPELQLASLDVSEGEQVEAGQLLCTLESTKSTSELYAEVGGYVLGLAARQGDVLRSGTALCWIAAKPDWEPPEVSAAPQAAADGAPEGLRITEPARRLAEDRALDLSTLPVGPLITEGYLQNLLDQGQALELDVPLPISKKGELLLYGGGGHAKSLIELIQLLEGYSIVGVIDDRMKAGTRILDIPVLGPAEALPDLYGQGVRLAVNAVGGVGDVMSRVRIFRRLIEVGFDFPTLVHPTAFIEASAQLAAGVQVFPHAYVGSEARVGFGGIVNTGAVVSHDCALGRYVNVAPSASLAGGVTLGKAVLVGMSVTVNLAVSVGDGARIGNSAVVKADVPAGQVVRAGAIWP
jgi:acetyltransferase EpsM